MAQFPDERTSEPLKLQHGEREESQKQQDAWPKPSAPVSQTKETQVADEEENDVSPSPKKSMLRRVKDRAKTYMHKHGYGHSKEQGEEEDHDELEEEDGKENTEGEKKEKAEDLNSNFSSRSSDAGSAVSPALDASSAPVETRRQQEVPTADAVSAVSPALDASSAPVETRRQQEVPTADAVSAVSPALDASSAPVETRRQQEVPTADAGSAVSPALDASSAPVETRGQQEVPTTPVNRRNEALENEYYGKDKAEKSDYSDAFPRAPKDPEGMMKSINEESAVETVQNQEAAKDRWYDADDTVAGAPTVKDQNPNLSHPGTTEPISDELEDADQDKLGDKEIRGPAGLSDEPQASKALQEASSEEFNENAGRSTALEDDESYKEKIHDTTSTEYGTNVASKRGNDEQQSIHEPPYEPDRMAEKENYENSEEGKSYGDQIYDKDPTEEGKSYGDQIYDIDPTEKIEPSSKFGHGEHQEPGQEETEKRTEPDRMAEEENYENSEKGKSYGDQIYDIDPTEKTELPSKFGHGEHQEPGQEETERRTERVSTDDVEEANEGTGKSSTGTPSAAESIVSSNPAVEEKFEGQAIGIDEDDVNKKTKSDGKSLTETPSVDKGGVSSNPVVEEKADGQTGETYEDDVEEKTKSDGHDPVAGKSYSDQVYSTANTAKGALFSVFGYGGAKAVPDKQIQPTDRKE
eukprot:PITA_06044